MNPAISGALILVAASGLALADENSESTEALIAQAVRPLPELLLRRRLAELMYW